MRRLGFAFALAGVLACGARRTDPEPAVSAPMTAKTAEVGAEVNLLLHVGCRAHLAHVEWSAVAADGSVSDQAPVRVDRAVSKGDQHIVLPWGKAEPPSRVQGTVHGRCTLGPAVRYPFSLPTTAAPLASPDISP